MTTIKKIHVSNGFTSDTASSNTLLDIYATDDESTAKGETIASKEENTSQITAFDITYYTKTSKVTNQSKLDKKAEISVHEVKTAKLEGKYYGR